MSALPLATTPPRISIDRQFDRFLYAQIGEEPNGMQLSVLSALARQDVDPWEIAQQLTSLAREPAIRLLTPLLARIPASASDKAAPEVIAARLVALLPSPHPSDREPGVSRIEQKCAPPVPMIDRIRLIVAFALCMLFSQWLLSGLSPKATAETPKSPAASASTPAATTTVPGH